MKQLLLLLSCALGSSAMAQPVLEQDDFQPVLDQEFTLNNANYIDPGMAGENAGLSGK